MHRPRRFLLCALAACTLGAGPAQAAPAPQRDSTISSFDGTTIALSFFPADDLRPGQKAPTVLYGPGWSQSRPQDSGNETGGVEGTFGSVPVRALRRNGYNVITWDPRGFGQSGGTVTVDATDKEGRDVQALLTFAARQPEALLDAPGDPRAGMTGASYGGGIQLVVAAIDNRLDAIVPDIAWHSLVTSLYKDQTLKGGWGSVLTSAGVPASKGRLDPHITNAFQEGTATGHISDANVAWFASRGPGKLVERIRIPTFLTQGTVDTLFTLDEAAINYAILRRNGVPTKMLWFCGGHGSCLTPAGDPARLPDAVFAWLRRWLKRDTSAVTGPRFQWVDQVGGAHSATDFPLAGAPAITATGSGILPLSPGPGEGGGIASTRSTKAVDVAIPAPAAPTHLVGAPRLTLSYTGTAAMASTRLYAQVVDGATGLVLGNQATPIPVVLDGKARTVTRALEMVSALANPGSGMTLQIFGASSVWDVQRTGGSVTLSGIRVALPAVDLTKPPPGYPVPIGPRLRRATLRLGTVASLAGARSRALAVRVSAIDGQVRNVVLTVRGARGRVEGLSRARTFSGSRRIVVRLRRVLPAGRYTVTATGRRPDGSPVLAAGRWTKRARSG